MRVDNLNWTADKGWTSPANHMADAQLVLYFAGPRQAQGAFDQLRGFYPQAQIVGCSTGGEIIDEEVADDSIAASALLFDKTTVQVTQVHLSNADQSHDAGKALAQGLPLDGLRAVFVLADGTLTNGSALIAGMREILAEPITITGGLAGDGADFKQTFVGCNAPAQSGQIAAIGFYGDAFQLGWGSFGGWDRFGPERKITKSQANVLFELDGEPALSLYKRYLGDEADKLPGSALLFPLTVRPESEEMAAVVRTIVGVDEASQSLTFAGDVPQGWVAQLMRGHFDGLVDGANRAGEAADADARCSGDRLALLVSCIGRKLLMGQRIVDEVEAAADALGRQTKLNGFYSYGEIAPHGFTGRCELHNQTMTITVIGEA